MDIFASFYNLENTERTTSSPIFAPHYLDPKRLEGSGPPDVTVISSDKVEFQAHKNILAESSGYFKEKFQEDQDATRVELPDIDGPTLSAILDGCYPSISTDISPHLEVLEWAHMYELPDLVSATCIALGKMVTAENCEEIWEANQVCQNKQLDNCLGEWCNELVGEALFHPSQPEFANFIFESLKNSCDKVTLVIAILKWSKSGPEWRDLDGQLAQLIDAIPDNISIEIYEKLWTNNRSRQNEQLDHFLSKMFNRLYPSFFMDEAFNLLTFEVEFVKHILEKAKRFNQRTLMEKLLKGMKSKAVKYERQLAELKCAIDVDSVSME